MRFYDGLVNELKRDEVFVFGSNLQGIHGAGAAKFAYDKGWVLWGDGEGLSHGPNGISYCFPTVKSLRPRHAVQSIEEIRECVHELYACAAFHPEYTFFVGYTNTPNLLCGYSIDQLMSCFLSHKVPENVVFSSTLKGYFE